MWLKNAIFKQNVEIYVRQTKFDCITVFLIKRVKYDTDFDAIIDEWKYVDMWWLYKQIRKNLWQSKK